MADMPCFMYQEHDVVAASVLLARRNFCFTKEFEEIATWGYLFCTKTVVAVLVRTFWNTMGPIISRSDACRA